ncbi:hypothetical protein M0R45_001576 [Rubus argutus]|uniref:F-box domain-containing protein n=1 Tax=Rubus argutus TaxID=59490 RepID=A0AAW1VG66_RUBAR
MRPKKRVAVISPIHSEEQEEERQPQGFQQLPQGLVVDILSRLSVKTLFHCRCVCKSWVCIISDPHFHHLRVSRLPMPWGWGY